MKFKTNKWLETEREGKKIIKDFFVMCMCVCDGRCASINWKDEGICNDFQDGKIRA